MNGSTPAAPASRATSHFRWVICALLFAGTTINYIDRQILALLKPILDRELGWTNEQFGYVNSAFFTVYAACYALFGWFVDRYGTKIGYATAAFLWSLAAMAHGAVSSVRGFFFARIALGFGEAGNFPSTVKSMGLWFSRRERAFASSLFTTGPNVSAIIAPALVPWIAYRWGWQMSFVVMGAAGLVWLVFWLALYSTPERSSFVSAAELADIRSDVEEGGDGTAPIRWRALLRFRQTWVILVAKFLTDPIYWFFLIWLPDFYKKTRGLDLKGSWPLLVTIYAIATVFSVAGGWLTGFLLTRGWTLTRARKTGLLIFALCVVPVLFAPHAGPAAAVIVIGVACGAHQAWSANIYALNADLFPKKAVAGIAGVSGMVGAIGGIIFPAFAGWLLDHCKASGAGESVAYAILFGICSSAYVVAFVITHLLAPRFERMSLPANG